ncbi:hypothetical protein VP01_3355g2 [Puccinia sorghi]|uniref:Uncharacterized protein n=1 Tax=Puccinia sorghi TaxID=27349 RepID=A0A0L6UXV4_9BASI|nr:hypothetical protein VP01_3355g2 [Puccinia sorghi]
MPKSNIKLKGGSQSLMMSRISFLKNIFARGIRKSMYLEAVCQILRLIEMALFKLEEYQMAAHNFIEPLTRVPNFLKILFTSTKQKHLTIKLSVAYYLCDFYLQQSHQSVLKTHIFKKLFTSVNLDQSSSFIHDMWTKKGNHFCFIGASVSFIDNNWNYVFQHLSLKLVARNQKVKNLRAEYLITQTGSDTLTEKDQRQDLRSEENKEEEK